MHVTKPQLGNVSYRKRRVKTKAQGFITWEHFRSPTEASMRIRFGTRVFLLMIAVILIASYWGYSYYLRNYKIIAKLNITEIKSMRTYEVIFASTELDSGKLHIVWNLGKDSQKNYDYNLASNKKYHLIFADSPNAGLQVVDISNAKHNLIIPADAPNTDFFGGTLMFLPPNDLTFGRGITERWIATLWYVNPNRPRPNSTPDNDTLQVGLAISID